MFHNQRVLMIPSLLSSKDFSGLDVVYAIRYDSNERLTSTKNYEDSAISFSANTSQKITKISHTILDYHMYQEALIWPSCLQMESMGPQIDMKKVTVLDREVSKNIDLGFNFKHGNSTIDFSVQK